MQGDLVSVATLQGFIGTMFKKGAAGRRFLSQSVNLWPAGWDRGVMDMQLGEVAKLTIPGDEGYGGGGFPAWGYPFD